MFEEDCPITVSKKALEFYFSETQVEYTIGIEIKNNSETSLKNLTVNDEVPREIEVFELEMSPEKEEGVLNNTYTWKLNEMTPGETILIKYKIRSKDEPESLPQVSVTGEINGERCKIESEKLLTKLCEGLERVKKGSK